MTRALRLAALVGLLATGAAYAADFTLTILHTNDIHARVEPARFRGKDYGGQARLATLIRQEKANSINPLLVDAGDVFQGTLYFNVYEGLADLAFMNSVGYRAMAVGNHEFDRGPKPLANFARLAAFPVLAANIDVSEDPDLKDLVKPFTIVEIGGEKVGLVGAITDTTPSIASPGPTVKFLPTVPSIQSAVDQVKAQGVNKVILLSHQGYDVDLDQSSKLRGVDVIVGGHSHTLLGNVVRDGFPNARGSYPTVRKGADGKTTLVVQAWQWGLLLGKLQVTFDSAGDVLKWSDTPPLVVDDTIAPDPTVASIIAAFKRPIADLENKPVGKTDTGLSRDGVREGEAIMSNVIADAMLEATRKAGAVAAFTNSGGVRASIEPGEITYGEAIQVVPFNNTLVVMDLSGAELTAALEHGAGEGGMLHPSKGFSYTIDFTKPAGQRVVSVTIDGQPIVADRIYKVTMNSFIASGGDGHVGLRDSKRPRLDTGLLDVDALVQFLQTNNPLNPKLEGRIKTIRRG